MKKLDDAERGRISEDTRRQLLALCDELFRRVLAPDAPTDDELAWLHKQVTSLTRRWQERQEQPT